MSINYIVREVPAEQAELSFVFDDDGLTEAGGDYCYNLFILSYGYHGRLDGGFNLDEYRNIQKTARGILNGFDDVEHPGNGYCWTSYTNYKEVMEDYGIKYNSRKCHALKEWAKNADESEAESISEYLTITTGKKWAVTSVHGYCQGDYCEIVYCVEYHEQPEYYGEVWLGCAKEFAVIEIENYEQPEDEDGDASYTEKYACYGYIVADCQAWHDEDYKRLVCEWAGIPEDETQLEMIDGQHTYTKYEYRIA